MGSFRRNLISAAALSCAALTTAGARPLPVHADAGYTMTTRTFTVVVGPNNDQTCTMVGDLYVPTAASAAAPVPAILTTNGFGGSKNDQAPMARYFAPRGYEVLSYSGLGFGGSGCQIELDDPDWDGKAASQLISFLGNRPEVIKDGADDPRVGMIGGSYGGGVQFSTAAIDHRLDTIVPVITWNDLAYSLAPNNYEPARTIGDAPPGVPKWQWTELFFGDGMAQPIENAAPSPPQPSTCPGFDPRVCPADAETIADGYPPADVLALLHHASMYDFHSRVHIPTMLVQGEADSLFTFNEAITNYQEIKANGAPVKLVFQSWGHSNATPAPGEYDWANGGYEDILAQNWFDHYLKKLPVSTGPAVEYFRDWVRYSGSAAPAYGNWPSYPVGTTKPFYLSGDGTLVAAATQVTPGTLSMLNPAGGQPASYSETSGVQDQAPFSTIPPSDPPGESVSFTSAPLAQTIDSVGIPGLDVTISAPLSADASPAAQPTVVAKIYDVAPDGSVTLPERLVAPARLIAGTQRYHLVLPGLVHRYAAGHRVRLVLAATDSAYITSRTAGAIQVVINSNPAVLSLPSVPLNKEGSGARTKTYVAAAPAAATAARHAAVAAPARRTAAAPTAGTGAGAPAASASTTSVASSVGVGSAAWRGWLVPAILAGALLFGVAARPARRRRRGPPAPG